MQRAEKPQESNIGHCMQKGTVQKSFPTYISQRVLMKSHVLDSQCTFVAHAIKSSRNSPHLTITCPDVKKRNLQFFPKCLFCDKSFLKEAQLWQHCDVCMAPRPCKLCNETFQGMKELERHFLECRKKYQCKICQRCFKIKCKLRTTSSNSSQNSAKIQM